jgi:hypothetical protein
VKSEVLMGVFGQFVEAQPNWRFWSASYKNSQHYFSQCFRFGKKSQYETNVIFTIALVQGINDKGQYLGLEDSTVALK